MGCLDRYNEMRDFDRTPEPSDSTGAGHLALRYSMQKHAATRLHFDLRLEWDGVLLSWAVTRGPSYDTGEKRLAVRTEDHPLSYLTFEGTIPKGNYGAGIVMLWDIGHWEPLIPVEKGLAKGHLHMRLHGARLAGDWHLVRMKSEGKRENWLMTKADDDAAGARDPVTHYRRSVLSNRTKVEISGEKASVVLHSGKRPSFAKPQLATLSDEMVEGEGWWHEVKFDGYRAQVALGAGGARVFTRNGKDWTEQFDSLLPAFDELDCENALIDGEIVAGAGVTGFSGLQQAIKAGGPFRFYGFDLLSCDGSDVTSRPLTDRRALLEKIWKPLPLLGPAQLSPVIVQDAAETFDTICASGGEGIIAKRLDAAYQSKRSTSWRKIKCQRRDEFVILGWQESDKRGRPFASLALGVREGKGWSYLGKVGTGFNDDQMADLAAAMRPLVCKTAPVDITPAEARGITWITPRLVAEISYAERTSEGRLRHAVFHGLRADKPARAVTLDNDVVPEDRPLVAGIGISSPERLVFPGAAYTKLQVAQYYERTAERILHAAADRPLSLLRLPEGLKGQQFFQKHAGKGFPEGLKVIDITQSDGKAEPYMFVADAAGLVAAAQMGTIEFHIWGSRRDRLERPDRMVFDLDPDEGLGFDAVKEAAVDIRDTLQGLGLPSWPLLSGGKGVHVVVPLRRVSGWDTVKLYAHVFSQLVASRAPDRYTTQMSKAKRKGRIFIDWLRNERGATAIAPFSLRARQNAPVAVPVSWEELADIKSAAAFTLETVAKRSWENVEIPPAVGITAKSIERLEAAFK
ncbi:ATP-dependent DNA ligase LigD phosphoesterase module/ATP-dependent DNA ligase LigD polymerase module [Sulfitobacter brevis]|uniref:DNA ligase (ATP) n=1 Tax=Sulfitobacter brevis TaxID=74348 RepID=A0A1I2FT78_9RHOB|nr:DNA ligase D [Sulfitobacter brevis]SFF07870.1 ATP-dependent DNA ligase LigD phosphoesterase module/ATP-dependent DNA ligase LigD polymerase module [Sulfitobacter brevis]